MRSWQGALISTLCIGFVVAIGWYWVAIFYLGWDLPSILSFSSIDPPYLPTSVSGPVRILGSHYFGDFQEPLSWAQGLAKFAQSPYEAHSAYLPLATLVMTPFLLLPVKIAGLLFLVVVAVMLAYPVWAMLKSFPFDYRILLISFGLFLSSGWIVSLDRGNLQGIFLGLIGIVLLCASKSAWRLACLILVLAAALKGYPIVLFVFIAAFGFGKLALKLLAAWLGFSVLLFAILPGGLASNLQGFQHSILGFTEYTNRQGNYSTSGLIDHLNRLFLHSALPHDVPVFLAVTLGILWTGSVWIVIRSKRVPQWVFGPLCLATLQMIPPVSYAYTLGWASLAMVWYVKGDLLRFSTWTHEPTPTDWQVNVLRISTLTMIVCAITPLVVVLIPGADGVTLMPILSPLSAWICLGLSLSIALRTPGGLTKCASVDQPSQR